MNDFWFRKSTHRLLVIINWLTGYKIWKKGNVPEVIM